MTSHLDPNQEFLTALSQLTAIESREEYRAYYNELGKVMSFAANQFPDSGKWINIDRELYITHNYQWLWVIDGKIVERKSDRNYYFSLTSSTKGVKVVKYHAGLVIEPDEAYENTEYYDKRTN